jgi:PTS system mannose-specific IID component
MENSKIKTLTKKDITGSFWRWTFFSHSNYNYERLAGSGFCHAIAPIISKLYKDDPEEFKAAIKRHMEFYNTEPHFGGVINGIVIAMEEQRANGAPISDEAINGLKTGVMGPFAGIGDTLWQGTLTPILLSIGISLAATGSLVGPIVYTVSMMSIMLSIAYYIWMSGYNLGKEGLQRILESNMLKRVITGASAMGAIVMGALTAGFVNISTKLQINIQGAELNVQTDILDKLFRGLLPLGLTLGTLYLLKIKKYKATTVMLILIALAAIGGVLGVF